MFLFETMLLMCIPTIEGHQVRYRVVDQLSVSLVLLRPQLASYELMGARSSGLRRGREKD